MTSAIVVRGMFGLGDSILQAGFIREGLKRWPGFEIYLSTTWPELLEDVPEVRFIRPYTTLRTQAENVASNPSTRWAAMPEKRNIARDFEARYTGAGMRQTNIARSMANAFGFLPADPPTLPAWSFSTDFPQLRGRPYVVVRPPTVRTEWSSPARNPRPEYVAAVAGWLRERGFAIVTVASLKKGEEDLVGAPIAADLELVRGELEVRKLLVLCRDAAALVGPVGWIAWAGPALRVPTFLVAGGLGGYNAPERIYPPEWRDRIEEIVSFAMPDFYCRCVDMSHECSKDNSHLRQQFEAWNERHFGDRRAA
jgi:hypothetical protein